MPKFSNSKWSFSLLKISIKDKISKIGQKKVGQKKVEKCKFGQKCIRLFCAYSHRYLFVKNNRIPNFKTQIVYSCSECDQTFDRKDFLDEHSNTHHIVAKDCNETAVKQSFMSKHSEETQMDSSHKDASEDSDSDDYETSSDSIDPDESFEESSGANGSETESGEVSSG